MKRTAIGLMVLALVGCGKSEVKTAEVKPVITAESTSTKLETEIQALFVKTDVPAEYANEIGMFFDKYGFVAYNDNILEDAPSYKTVAKKAKEIVMDKRFNDSFSSIAVCQKAADEWVKTADLRKLNGVATIESSQHKQAFVDNRSACGKFAKQ